MTSPTSSPIPPCPVPAAAPVDARWGRLLRSGRVGLQMGVLALVSGGVHAQSLIASEPAHLGGPFLAQAVDPASGPRRLPGLGLAQAPATTDAGAQGGAVAPLSAEGAKEGGAVKDSRSLPAVGDDEGVPLEMRNPALGKSTQWYVQTSLYTQHFHPDEAHQNHQRMIDIEYWREDGWLGGFAWFKNSFGQPTQYLFVGKRWRPFDSVPRAYVRVAGGILHGYKGEYRDRLPLNSSGFAPVILPGIGYSGRRFGSELIFFGTNGVMLTFGAYLY